MMYVVFILVDLGVGVPLVPRSVTTTMCWGCRSSLWGGACTAHAFIDIFCWYGSACQPPKRGEGCPCVFHGRQKRGASGLTDWPLGDGFQTHPYFVSLL